MQSIRPAGLTDRELLQYVWIMGYDKVPPEWVEELAKRLEAATLDDLK